MLDQSKGNGVPGSSAVPDAQPLFERRPWGSFEQVDAGTMHQVKRISMIPGKRLSLQYHHHRCEHWVVVNGTATVTVDDKTFLLGPKEHVFIPQGAKHRLENAGKIPLDLIEVQYGGYLGDDDIVRVEDDFDRPETYTLPTRKSGSVTNTGE